MDATTNTTLPAADDVALGYTVIGHALNVLAAGITIAIAWSCSTVLMGMVMLIVMGLVMYLLSYAAFMLVALKVSTANVARVGHAAGALSVRITSLFSRKATPAVAA